MSWDDPKPTKSTPVQINVKVPEHCERFLRLLAASLGYTRGKSASIREFLIALGNGQYRLVPGSLSPNGIETLNLIVDRILSQNTFCVCVKSGDGLKIILYCLALFSSIVLEKTFYWHIPKKTIHWKLRSCLIILRSRSST